jgi:hypothetical protein
MLPLNASAQFLRLGPFDFDAKTGVDAIYTTNVEQERASEATADREDYYLVWRLDLRSFSEIANNTTLEIDSGLAIEKHFNRTDLDNSGAPFGRVGARLAIDLEPLFLYGGARWERTSESVDDVFVGSSFPSKKRQVGTITEYLAGADWRGEYITTGASYKYSEERFDDDEFILEDLDEETTFAYIDIKIAPKLSVGYSVENVDSVYPNDPESNTDEKTERITLDFAQPLLERPKIEYSVGVQREYTDGETDGWELIHLLSLSDKYDLSSTVIFDWFVSYSYEQKPEGDEVPLEFGANLTHEITTDAQQIFSARRQPVDTLGSDQDTDETDYRYALKIKSFLLVDWNFDFSVGYKISDPVEGDTERVLDYLVGYSRTKQLSSRLSRKLAFDYTWEDSNFYPDILEEFRVTLSFDYMF